MPNVYVEACPKGRPEGSTIEDFVAEDHADHVLGMDDLRPLSFTHPKGLPLYADDATADIIERIFEYTFRKTDRYATSARVVMHRLPAEVGVEIPLFGATFVRVPVTHGRDTIAGYRFGDAAYLTDMSDIPAESLPLLEGDDAPLGVDDLTTHQWPLDKAPEAYSMFQKKEDGAIKVVLKP